MEQQLSKYDGDNEPIRLVVTKHDELLGDTGYEEWWSLETMEGDSHKISEKTRDAIIQASGTAKYLELPNGDWIATHQIKGIVRRTRTFENRS